MTPPNATPLEKSKGGRPTKFTGAQEIILACLRENLPISSSCAVAQVSKGAFFAWLARGEKEPNSQYGAFSRQCRAAISEAELSLLRTILRAAKTQWQAAGWILERRYWKTYGKRTPLAEAPAPPSTFSQAFSITTREIEGQK